ncbi:MAG TPA: serine/threonine protein phosphatase [Clostridiaceae bacterium]|jgi:predicted phosphohydrolase|nr:serine/threonine protein phosphatase [Clostridiaceae bacterium]
MDIYAISDLHLSLGTDKPMDVFGWGNHVERIKENWLNKIKDEDLILIPGDISWGINLEETDPDFAFIESLSGNKIISKGNHDYWWSTRRKFESYCNEKGYKTISILHNNSFTVNNYTICGTRGWKPLDDDSFKEEDKKIYYRELERLKLSLKEGQKSGNPIIAMLHYPPFDSKHRPNEFAGLLAEYNVSICVYGHIHGRYDESWKDEFIEGIRYHLISANIIGFNPIKLRLETNVDCDIIK